MPLAPGQFAMLYAFGIGEAPISVSAIEGGVEHTIRAARPVTVALGAVETLASAAHSATPGRWITSTAAR